MGYSSTTSFLLSSEAGGLHRSTANGNPPAQLPAVDPQPQPENTQPFDLPIVLLCLTRPHLLPAPMTSPCGGGQGAYRRQRKDSASVSVAPKQPPFFFHTSREESAASVRQLIDWVTQCLGVCV